MRSISARVVGRSTSGVTTSGSTGRQGADPAPLLGVGVRQSPGFFLRIHGGDKGFLFRRIFWNPVERIAQHGRIVGANRTDIGATAATGPEDVISRTCNVIRRRVTSCAIKQRHVPDR